MTWPVAQQGRWAQTQICCSILAQISTAFEPFRLRNFTRNSWVNPRYDSFHLKKLRPNCRMVFRPEPASNTIGLSQLAYMFSNSPVWKIDYGVPCILVGKHKFWILGHAIKTTDKEQVTNSKEHGSLFYYYLFPFPILFAQSMVLTMKMLHR